MDPIEDGTLDNVDQRITSDLQVVLDGESLGIPHFPRPSSMSFLLCQRQTNSQSLAVFVLRLEAVEAFAASCSGTLRTTLSWCPSCVWAPWGACPMKAQNWLKAYPIAFCIGRFSFAMSNIYLLSPIPDAWHPSDQSTLGQYIGS